MYCESKIETTPAAETSLRTIEKNENITHFEKHKYVVVRDFFQQKDIVRMNNRMNILLASNNLKYDEQCPKSPSIYGDPIQAEMMLKYQEKLENVVGKNLFPTYSYARIYKPKEILHPHKDRPSCEISLTGTLSFDTYDNKPWQIFVESNETDVKLVSVVNEQPKLEKKALKKGKFYHLFPGDVLVYRGCEVDHWREEFVGVQQTQVFFHYVDADGPYKEYKYDGRPSLGSSQRVCKLKPEIF